MSGMEPIRSNRSLSLHLSRVLDEAGVSERTVSKRRQTMFKCERVLNLVGIRHDIQTSYVFGSKIEGSTTPGLNSDADGLFHSNHDTAIQSMPEWKPGNTNVLVLQGGDIPAGYCRLQLLSRCVSLSTWLGTGCSSTRDDEGRYLLEHNAFPFPADTVHGPARTYLGDRRSCDHDIVYGFKCDSVSKQVEPWIRRMQNKQWPTRDMLRTATESGFFIVPVGHRLSATRKLEWRVSPSLTERCLMFGMNITQMQTYVILKMIKTAIIIPTIGESITSFHLKNVLFHCVENTPKELWRDANLVACIDVCLKYLLSCVQKRSCPNYLIPGENLFFGKISEEQISHLEKLLYEFVESDSDYLLRIECDQVGNLLEKCLNSPTTIDPDRFVLEKGYILGNLEIYVNETQLKACEDTAANTFVNQLKACTDIAANTLVNPVLGLMGYFRNIQTRSDYLTKSDAISIIQILFSTYGYAVLASMCIRGDASLSRVQGTIGKLRNIRKCSDYLTKSDATSILQILYSTYGSMLASMCIRGGIGLTQGALSYLERGCGYDLMSGRLKKASALYCCGRYREAASVLKDVDSRYDFRCVQPACCCHRELPHNQKDEFMRRVYFDDTTSDTNKLIACHVAFTSSDIYCCPIALRFDLYRGFLVNRILRCLGDDSWMDMAAVDSVIFLYFLMYLTYGSMRNYQLKRNALRNLISSMSTKEEQNFIIHNETAFNLLGQCYEMEGEPDNAVSCYRTSLQHMPRNNSALWHVSLLIYTHFWRRLFVNRHLSLTFGNV